MMRRVILILLISLGFMVNSNSLLAQSVTINPALQKTQSGPASKQIDNTTYIDQWGTEQHMKSNFEQLKTVPFFSNDHLQINLGPAQFQIRVPFN